jgi:hypothetical protein
VSDCAGNQEVRKLSAGTTVFDSTLCTIRTKELFIQGIGNVREMVNIAARSDFSTDLYSMDGIIDDIALSQTINLVNQTTLLSSYLENKDDEGSPDCSKSKA